ncbi:MAG: hypothetical protein R3E98_16560 [Gemmatimonadota bacterium]
MHRPVVLLCLVAACGGESTDARPSRVDSAGVELISNARPLWSGSDAWRIGPALLTLGNEREETQLGDAVQARWATDGSVWISDLINARIHLYGPDGAWERSLGGRGGGPGEYQGSPLLAPVGSDSMGVSDGGSRRLTILDRSGLPARTLDLPNVSPYGFSLLGRRSDGRLLLQASSLMYGPGPDGAHWIPAPLLILRSDGAPPDTVLTYDHHHLVTAAGRPVVTFLGTWASLATDGDLVFVGRGDRARVDVHDAASGVLVRSLRWARIPGLVDQALKDSIRTEMLHPYPPAPPSVARQFDAIWANTWWPERRPLFERLVVDPGGALWVGVHQVQRRGGRTWTVFDPTGLWLGDVTAPEGFEIEQIGDDAVLGIWKDDLDVSWVQVRRLDRQAR